MRITFDPEKNAKNIEERGLSFEKVEELDWESAFVDLDVRKDYGEVRLQVFALLGERLHLAIATPRRDSLRVISFRKANQREIKRYADYQNQRGTGVSS